MASWQDVLSEMNAATVDTVRRKHLAALSSHTGRNTIAYYSGFLTNNAADSMISDNDINGFMNAIHGLDRSKGLDIILHTPGGTVSAAGAIVFYLRQMFKLDIRCFVPQIAMSAGTMIACSCKEIWMGKQSSIGPIDPQFNGISTGEIIEEYKQAVEEIQQNPKLIPLWQIRMSKYPPAFIGQCQKASELSRTMVADWLKTNMFRENPDPDAAANEVVTFLGDHGKTKQHDRHIAFTDAENIGLVVKRLEDDDEIQDLLLTVHHSFMITFSGNIQLTKIIENQNGHAIINRTVQR